MRLSTIFELLLILLLVAFAAYGRVIDRDEATHRVARAADNVKQSDINLTTMSLKQATDSVNRYCTCNENICNCCRDFHIPLVQLKGPGCASLQYLQGDNLAVQLSFGDNILTSTIVNGKSPKPVCVPLPGGFNKFCGRIYSIQRDAKNHFKACLGLELQSPTELEATLRVSCFRFGPEGLKLRPAEPLPVVETEVTSEEDDDDDFFGLGSDDDDDDDDDEDDERPITNTVPDASGVDNAQESDDDDDDDILGFSALLDIFTGGDDDAPTRPQVTTGPPLLEFTIPILPRPTTPVLLEDHELPTFPNNNEQENNYEEHDDTTQEPLKAEGGEEEEDTGALTEESNTEDNTDENNEQITESSNKIVYTAKPDKAPTVNKVKKGVIGNKKKPTVTSTSVNAIQDPEKPAKKPVKNEDDDDDDDILDDDDDEDVDDEDDDLLDDDDDEKDDEDEDDEDEDKLEDEKHEEHDDDEDVKADLDDLDDDDDDDDEEEENAMLSALMGTGKSKKSKEDTKTNQTNVHKHDDEDYDLGFLGRERHSNENRQSKITRL